jgi:hypothetical protein
MRASAGRSSADRCARGRATQVTTSYSKRAPAVADRRWARRHDGEAIRRIAGEDRSGDDIGVHRGHSSWNIMLKLSPDRCHISGQWWLEGARDTVPPGS